MRHTFLEIHVRFARHRNVAEGFGEPRDGFRGIGAQKLLRLPDAADLENGRQQIQHIQNGGNALAQREVHGFDFRPEWKRPVGDHQRVGVADAGDQVKNLRVEDTSLEHGVWIG